MPPHILSATNTFTLPFMFAHADIFQVLISNSRSQKCFDAGITTKLFLLGRESPEGNCFVHLPRRQFCCVDVEWACLHAWRLCGIFILATWFCCARHSLLFLILLHIQQGMTLNPRETVEIMLSACGLSFPYFIIAPLCNVCGALQSWSRQLVG